MKFLRVHLHTTSLVKKANQPTKKCHTCTFWGGWKGCIWVQKFLPPSTEAPLRVCWQAASLSGTRTTVLQTKEPWEMWWGQLRGLLGSCCYLLRAWPNNAAHPGQKHQGRLTPQPQPVLTPALRQTRGVGWCSVEVSFQPPSDCWIAQKSCYSADYYSLQMYQQKHFRCN